MHFSFSAVAAIVAMATSAIAQTANFDSVTYPTSDEVIDAGSTYTIKWTTPAQYAGDTISISLIGGATQDTQIPIMTIATGVMNSAESYTWKIPTSLGAMAVYGLIFKDEADTSIFQYSMPFHIKASGSGATSSTATTASATGPTTTITTSAGIKTVTLHATTTHPNTTTCIMKNMTSTASTWYSMPTLTVITSTAQVEQPSTTAAATKAPVATAGAPCVGSSSIALVGALVMAYLAL